MATNVSPAAFRRTTPYNSKAVSQRQHTPTPQFGALLLRLNPKFEGENTNQIFTAADKIKNVFTERDLETVVQYGNDKAGTLAYIFLTTGGVNTQRVEPERWTGSRKQGLIEWSKF